MTFNPKDDYEALGKLFYPSIEASGNVYYGQTRKLTLDELFKGGFRSSVVSGDDGLKFYWSLGPISDYLRLSPEVDDSVYLSADLFLDDDIFIKISSQDLSETITDTIEQNSGSLFIRYEVSVLDSQDYNILDSGNFKSFAKNVQLSDRAICFMQPRQANPVSLTEPSNSRNVFLSDDTRYLYILLSDGGKSFNIKHDPSLDSYMHVDGFLALEKEDSGKDNFGIRLDGSVDEEIFGKKTFTCYTRFTTTCDIHRCMTPEIQVGNGYYFYGNDDYKYHSIKYSEVKPKSFNAVDTTGNLVELEPTSYYSTCISDMVSADSNDPKLSIDVSTAVSENIGDSGLSCKAKSIGLYSTRSSQPSKHSSLISYTQPFVGDNSKISNFESCVCVHSVGVPNANTNNIKSGGSFTSAYMASGVSNYIKLISETTPDGNDSTRSLSIVSPNLVLEASNDSITNLAQLTTSNMSLVSRDMTSNNDDNLVSAISLFANPVYVKIKSIDPSKYNSIKNKYLIELYSNFSSKREFNVTYGVDAYATYHLPGTIYIPVDKDRATKFLNDAKEVDSTLDWEFVRVSDTLGTPTSGDYPRSVISIDSDFVVTSSRCKFGFKDRPIHSAYFDTTYTNKLYTNELDCQARAVNNDTKAKLILSSTYYITSSITNTASIELTSTTDSREINLKSPKVYAQNISPRRLPNSDAATTLGTGTEYWDEAYVTDLHIDTLASKSNELQVANDITPSNGIISLGSSSKKWKCLYTDTIVGPSLALQQLTSGSTEFNVNCPVGSIALIVLISSKYTSISNLSQDGKYLYPGTVVIATDSDDIQPRYSIFYATSNGTSYIEDEHAFPVTAGTKFKLLHSVKITDDHGLFIDSIALAICV